MQNDISELEALWSQPPAVVAHEMPKPLPPAMRNRIRDVLDLPGTEPLGHVAADVRGYRKCGYPTYSGAPCRNQIAPEHIACHHHAEAAIAAQSTEQAPAPTTPPPTADVPSLDDSALPRQTVVLPPPLAMPDWATAEERELINDATQRFLDGLDDDTDRAMYRDLTEGFLDPIAPPDWWRVASQGAREVFLTLERGLLTRTWRVWMPGCDYSLNLQDALLTASAVIRGQAGVEVRLHAYPPEGGEIVGSRSIDEHVEKMEAATRMARLVQQIVKGQGPRRYWDGTLCEPPTSGSDGTA